MRRFLIAAGLVLPTCLFAAGMDDANPPVETETTQTCTENTVWSEDSQSCVAAESGELKDSQLYQAAREFAYAGRFPEALHVLAAMSDPLDDRVLTYRGFVYRKLGDIELGNSYYRQAIARNPDNLLARSYMGQGFVESGDLAAARAQLTEIRARGGRGTWPEVSLRLTIERGTGYSY